MKSAHCLAVVNIAPILSGHAMVIPIKHYQHVLALPDDVYSDMMHFMRRVSAVLLKAYAAGGINWTLQEGEEAGQTVPHLHFHLIPRHADDLDNPGDWYPKLKEHQQIDSTDRRRLTPQEMSEIVSYLKSFV